MFNIRWRAPALAALVLATCGGATLWAQPAGGTRTSETPTAGMHPTSLVQQARSAMAAADYERAARLFSAAEEHARESGDSTTAQRMPFYRALAYQRQAEASDDVQRARTLRERAILLYTEFLRATPDSAATYNNLARLYSALDQHDQALRYAAQARELAAESGDARTATYARTYADLSSRSSPDRAIDAYQAVAVANAQDVQAHETVLEYRLRGRPEPLLSYLWQLYANEQPRRAGNGALTALESATEGGPLRAHREELLALVAASLGKRFFDPADFVDSPTYRRLKPLAEDPEIGEGVLELFQLLVQRDWKAHYGWWSERGAVDLEAPRGLWPRAAFQQLMSGMARWYQQHDQKTVAERCYLLASEIDPRGVEPAAFHELAVLYAGRGDLDQLADLTRRHERQLYEQKLNAYRGGELDEIFQYHRTLGLVYARLGEWGDGNTVSSAIFQLEAARRTASRLQESPDEATPEAAPRRPTLAYRFSPDLTNLLAEGYQRLQQPLQAATVRLESAHQYTLSGDTKAAEQVLRPYFDQGLPQNLAPEVLQRAAPTLQHYVLQHPGLVSPDQLQVKQPGKIYGELQEPEVP